jgi:hypothetical protein
MSYKLKERLKEIIIYILAITGLIQVGILWSYQNQGTPTSFLNGLFDRTPQISNQTASEKLFMPDRFILTDGSSTHWVIEPANGHYKSLWEEASKELYQAVSGKADITRTDDKWSDIIETKSFLIDFGYNLKPDLLSWFLNVDGAPKQFPDIQKILIKPDIVDENSITLYICDDNGYVYTSDSVNWGKAAELDSLLNEISGSENKYRDYWTFSGTNMGEGVDEPDTIYVIGAPKYWPYFNVSMSTYAILNNEDELAGTILGYEKDRYSKSRDDSDTVEFGYGNNIYRYYTDGYLTYRYLGSTEYTDKKGVGEALINAYKLIARIQAALKISTDIRLTEIKENSDGSCTFGFDYRIDGMPVKVSVGSKDGGAKKLEHAISIRADGKRVMECDWLLREFAKGTSANYNDRFMDLLDNNGINFTDLSIRDIAAGYFVGSADVGTLEPALIVRQKNKDDLLLNMLPETGD